MREKSKQARLRGLDDLFQLGEHSPAPLAKSKGQVMVPIGELQPFSGHPFSLYEGERLQDMIESISTNGVLVPIIVRVKENAYEILSGHNRVNASRLAGLSVVPALVLEDISDDDAWVYVVETNTMQRSFADMAHSEKAAVITLHHSKMFSQGKRNDILRALETLANPHDDKSEGTSSGKSQKYDSRKNVAQEYGLKAYAIAQYLRVNRLIQPLKARLDFDEYALTTAATLSFLKDHEQQELERCLAQNQFSLDINKAKLLRQHSEKGKLSDESTYLILAGELGKKPKPHRTPTVKVAKAIYSKYFRANQSAREVQSIVEAALELYFTHNK